MSFSNLILELELKKKQTKNSEFRIMNFETRNQKLETRIYQSYK